MDILKAIETEPLFKIKDLIALDEHAFFSTWTGYKSLTLALHCGRKDIAKYLLSDSRCMVNHSSNGSDTPMHKAVILGDIDIIDSLLNRDASISVVNSNGDSPLHLAFLRRYDGIVDRMLTHLEKTLHYKNVKNKDNLTHLHIACTRSNKIVIVGFLKAKANAFEVFRKDSPAAWAGYTAMHFAVEFKSAEAVTILSKVFPNFNSEVTNGKTPLKLAQEYLQNLMIAADQLEKVVGSISYFHLACLKDKVEVVEKFLKNDADLCCLVDWQSDICNSYSPLHCVLDSPIDRKEKVKLLLKHGAHVGRRLDEEDTTALHLALYTEPNEEEDNPLNLLYAELEDKTDNVVDENGLSVFHIAVTRNDFDTVIYYLDNDIDVNQVVLHNSRNYSNFTALHFAIHFNHYEMAELLIKRGADVNANVGQSNETPLFEAFNSGSFDFVELLLKNGAKVDVTLQRNKQTLLHIIAEWYNSCKEESQEKILKYIEMLVLMGIDVNAKDDQNFTALHQLWWSHEKCAPCAKLLLDLGADINIKANEVGMPFEAFRGSDCCTEECMIFMMHVLKLKALGFYVSRENEKSYEIIVKEMEEENLKMMKKEVEDEVEMLKETKITAYFSLYDFLMLDEDRAKNYVRNGVLRKIVETVEKGEMFEMLGWLIKLRYREALKD